jgi:hypothetical protein
VTVDENGSICWIIKKFKKVMKIESFDNLKFKLETFLDSFLREKEIL